MKETQIIAFANHKGGVGKTTTTASVGSILAAKGYKVLLIDLDAQANLSASLLKNQEIDKTIYDALINTSVGLPIYPIRENLDLTPATLQLAMVDLEMASVIAREKILSELLDKVKANYDFILMDCPPSLALLTLNAVTAANGVIIPIVAEVLPFNGLIMIENFINMIHKKLNPEAHVTGILITRWEKTNLSKQIEEGMREKLGDKVFQTKIRKNVSIAEAPLEAQDIVSYAPKSNGAQDYLAFVNELLEKLHINK